MSEPLRILVDGRGCRRKGSGVGRMIATVVEELRRDRRFAFTVLTDTPEVWTSLDGVTCVPAGHGPGGWTESQRLAWEQWRLRRLIRAVRPDVYWATWNAGVPWPCAVPSVLTVHDVIPLRHPDDFGSRLWQWSYRLALRLSLRAATRIVAVSEATRRDLAARCGVDPARVTVVRHGVEPRFSPQAEAADFGLRGRVVLYVGGCEARKNLAALLAAFDRMAADPRLADVTLAVTGDRERLDPRAAEVLATMRYGDRVQLTGYVPDDRLPHLYRRASVFAFPTLEEGFGFPPLEALACGVPVVASGADSMPEVLGQAATIVEPPTVEGLAAALTDVLTHPAKAAELARRGPEQAAKFSWPEAARAMAAIFVECARE